MIVTESCSNIGCHEKIIYRDGEEDKGRGGVGWKLGSVDHRKLKGGEPVEIRHCIDMREVVRG
jgi:hypothetical protein